MFNRLNMENWGDKFSGKRFHNDVIVNLQWVILIRQGKFRFHFVRKLEKIPFNLQLMQENCIVIGSDPKWQASRFLLAICSFENERH